MFAASIVAKAETAANVYRVGLLGMMPVAKTHLAVQRRRAAARSQPRPGAGQPGDDPRLIVSDHVSHMPAFLADCGRWVREGRLKYREDVVEGLDQAPRAFIGLLRGENLGKLIVKVGPDPTRG